MEQAFIEWNTEVSGCSDLELMASATPGDAALDLLENDSTRFCADVDVVGEIIARNQREASAPTDRCRRESRPPPVPPT